MVQKSGSPVDRYFLFVFPLLMESQKPPAEAARRSRPNIVHDRNMSRHDPTLFGAIILWQVKLSEVELKLDVDQEKVRFG